MKSGRAVDTCGPQGLMQGGWGYKTAPLHKYFAVHRTQSLTPLLNSYINVRNYVRYTETKR